MSLLICALPEFGQPKSGSFWLEEFVDLNDCLMLEEHEDNSPIIMNYHQDQEQQGQGTRRSTRLDQKRNQRPTDSGLNSAGSVGGGSKRRKSEQFQLDSSNNSLLMGLDASNPEEETEEEEEESPKVPTSKTMLYSLSCQISVALKIANSEV